MHFFKKALILSLSLFLTLPALATEFDQYLQQQDILDQNFKIKDSTQLNALLNVLSAEDSRTLPLQIDQNTIIEQLKLKSDMTELKGLIVTPDFAQFERDLGRKEVHEFIQRNLSQNCDIFFEHEYQRVNPYRVVLNLSSQQQQYRVELQRADCAL
ncbi:hypothetical protein [uncultured Acinetobacter sp.]|uniref:hypothetical protein n=1 Tax=uncultured Acinetobacter sp. TaxID=165433 RepID=UPI0026137437|nr:hypothetical protein [uncultured Acinetobacter sp.]